MAWEIMEINKNLRETLLDIVFDALEKQYFVAGCVQNFALFVHDEHTSTTYRQLQENSLFPLNSREFRQNPADLSQFAEKRAYSAVKSPNEAG